MQDGTLSKEMKDALARLQSSFEALGATRDTLGQTLDSALVELTRRINEIDAELNSGRPSMRHGSTAHDRRVA